MVALYLFFGEAINTTFFGPLRIYSILCTYLEGASHVHAIKCFKGAALTSDEIPEEVVRTSINSS